MRRNFVLPLPRFILHPLTASTIAAVHVYLAYEHLSKLVVGDAEWVHVWKGLGALFGAYVFAALALHRAAKPLQRIIVKEADVENSDRVSLTGQIPVATNFSQK